MDPLYALAVAAGILAGTGTAGTIIIARSIRGSRAAALAADLALLARTGALPPAGRDDPCTRCRGRHCVAWQAGADCGPQIAPTAGSTLWSSTGAHAPAAVLAGLVDASWSPLAMRVRVALAPTWWTDRLGRPAQLGARVVLP